MKNIIIIIFLLFSCNLQKNKVGLDYEISYNRISPDLQEIASRYNQELFESQGNGAAIFTLSKIDTLESNNNYHQFRLGAMDTLQQDVWVATSKLEGDRLQITLGQMLGNEFIIFIVKKGQVLTIFKEWYKLDNVVKLKSADVLTNELEIPLEYSEVRLSKLRNFRIGEVVFGAAKIVTEPYFLQPLGFEFEKIKREYEVCFKFKVQ